MTEQPTIRELEAHLSALPTQPTDRYYDMMKATPWSNAITRLEQPATNRRRPVLLWAIAIWGILLFAVSGALAGLATHDVTYTYDTARTRINQILDTTIPETAHTLYFSENFFIYRNIRARFDAPADDVQLWLNAEVECFGAWGSSIDRSDYTQDSWWIDEEAAEAAQNVPYLGDADILSKRCLTNEVEHTLFVDKRVPAMWGVYLGYFR